MTKTEDPVKVRIIELFRKRVYGMSPDLVQESSAHDGSSGHWLERAMGLSPNSSNAPDFEGYEMKTGTRSKTTFGDWSADYYIYNDPFFGKIGRSHFLKIFGRPNPSKRGRFSWSGEPAPKITSINKFGQVLEVDIDNNILALYHYSKDSRFDKRQIVPPAMQRDRLIVAKWDMASIKRKLERKFNQKGWFKCNKDSEGRYKSIVFGAPLSFEKWIQAVKKGDVFFDSGMYEGNARPYSQWRANNDFWSSLVVATYGA
jgi:hypothetical protein